MSATITSRGTILPIVQHLNLRSEVNKREMANLLSLLAKSDIDSSSRLAFRNESETLAAKNRALSPEIVKRIEAIEPMTEKEFRVFRRETPFLSSRVPGSAPVWAHGAAPAHTIGPLTAIDGRLFWFDFYFYVKLVPVYVSGDAIPIMLVPLHLSILQVPRTEFNIAEGSIWLRADRFSASLNNNQWVGLRLSEGDLTLTAAHNVVNGALTINNTVGFNLTLTLNNQHNTQGNTVEGIDARESDINLPGACSFRFSNGKFALTALNRSSWTLYEEQRRFGFMSNAAAFFHPVLNRLVFPLETSPDAFAVKNCQSVFFSISGEAPIVTSGWCLSVAMIDISNPLGVAGNGALAVLCKKGLEFSWNGLQITDGSVQMKEALIMAEPGKFSVSDAFPDFGQQSEFVELWLREPDNIIFTDVTFRFNNDKPFIYYCYEEGAEAIAAFADADFQTDKPFQSDGQSVAPTTLNSLYLRYALPGIRYLYCYDADIIHDVTPSFGNLSEPEYYRFTIKNAYMLCTPPAALLLAGFLDENNRLSRGQMTIVYGLFRMMPILPHPYTTNQQLTPFEISLSRLKHIKDVKQWAPFLENFLQSTCSWNDLPEAETTSITLDFELLTDFFRALNNQPTGEAATGEALIQFLQQDALEELSLIYPKLYDNQPDYGTSLFSLLDLSTNYDLFGVSMVWNNRRVNSIRAGIASTVGSGVVTIEHLNLQAPMALLNIFTLPHISWEPVNNLAVTSEPGYPPTGILSFRDSGPPTVFSQYDPEPVDIDPLTQLERFRDNLAPPKKIPAHIIFGLPHGKVSLALLSAFNDEFATVKGNHDFIRPEFLSNGQDVKGGLQFRMAASTANQDRPMIAGVTRQLNNLRWNNAVDIPESILGGVVHDIFLNDFYRDNAGNPEIKVDGVPVTHLDFSGYGASTFSDWRNPQAKIAQVSQTRFDVMVGRVSHEIVQVVSILYPWGIRVIRTITLYRSGNAIIYREDSGWVAQSDGLFDFFFKISADGSNVIENPFAFYPGLVKGLFNVHNIKELDEQRVKFSYGVQAGEPVFNTATKEVEAAAAYMNINAEFAAVTFDADLSMDHIVSGEHKGRVTGRSFKGYLQVLPTGVPINASGLQQLFNQAQNLIGGNINCTMKIGGSEQLMKLNRVDMSTSYRNNSPADLIFVAAAKGSVQLPAEGSWSVVEVDKADGEVVPIANKDSLPLIRKGERKRNGSNFVLNGNDKISRLAFPDGLLNSGFSKRFGYVQNTGTQKLLLVDPKVDANIPQSLKTEAPLLADSYRLLNSKGPFPNLNNTIQIENVAEALTSVIPEGLQKTIENFTVPDNLSFDILGKDGDTLHMYVSYASNPTGGGSSKSVISYVTDSIGPNAADKWKNELDNLSVSVDMGPFKKLLTVSGNMKAKSSLDAGFDSGNAPQLVLCDELQPIYEILEFLANLDPTQPVDAIKKGLKIFMSNSADSWEYKFKAEKEIPIVKFPFDPINYNSPTTPLKLDAYFKVGCYFNQPIKIPNTIEDLTPSAGAFLELGADLRVMCVSLAAATVYATGRAEVGLAADIKNGPNLYFKFGFGIELCVGLPVIGSVSVMYLVGVDMKLTTQELTVGAFLYFRGRAEIFAGIVTITIQIEAAGKIQKQLSGGPTNCVASCMFALDISIFLVIDISFTETWEETRQIA